MEKPHYVENRPSWRQEYGSFPAKLAYLGDHLALLSQFADIERGNLRILDYGCAYGYHIRLLKVLNPRLDLHGVEIARDAATEAQKAIPAATIHWESCSARLPLEDASVDLIFSFDMIEHIAEEKELHAMLRESARLLRPNGTLLIETPNFSRRMRWLYRLTGQSHWLRHEHRSLFDRMRLENLVRPYFSEIRFLRRKAFQCPAVPIVKTLYCPRLGISGDITAIAQSPRPR